MNSSAKVDSVPLRDNYWEDANLYELVSKQNWHRVVRHCRQKRTRTAEASPPAPQAPRIYTEDPRKENALYLACMNRPPVQAVRGMLDAYPELAWAQNPQRGGELALHAACRSNGSIGILKELLKDHPGTACYMPPSGVTPLRLLWDSRGKVDLESKESYNTVFWNKVQALLEAVSRYRQDGLVGRVMKAPCGGIEEKDEYGHRRTILMAAVYMVSSLDCPPDIVEYALDKYPEQVGIRETVTGRLPLHVAVGPAVWTESVGRRNPFAHQQSVIGQLLEVHPDAASAKDPNEPSGRYPLHTALLNNHTWSSGVKELFENAPEALFYQDAATGLYSFQIAAIPLEGSTDVDLDTIYCLLRAEPGVLADKGVFCRGQWIETDTIVHDIIDLFEDSIRSVKYKSDQNVEELAMTIIPTEKVVRHSKSLKRPKSIEATGKETTRKQPVGDKECAVKPRSPLVLESKSLPAVKYTISAFERAEASPINSTTVTDVTAQSCDTPIQSLIQIQARTKDAHGEKRRSGVALDTGLRTKSPRPRHSPSKKTEIVSCSPSGDGIHVVPDVAPSVDAISESVAVKTGVGRTPVPSKGKASRNSDTKQRILQGFPAANDDGDTDMAKGSSEMKSSHQWNDSGRCYDADVAIKESPVKRDRDAIVVDDAPKVKSTITFFEDDPYWKSAERQTSREVLETEQLRMAAKVTTVVGKVNSAVSVPASRVPMNQKITVIAPSLDGYNFVQDPSLCKMDDTENSTSEANTTKTTLARIVVDEGCRSMVTTWKVSEYNCATTSAEGLETSDIAQSSDEIMFVDHSASEIFDEHYRKPDHASQDHDIPCDLPEVNQPRRWNWSWISNKSNDDLHAGRTGAIDSESGASLKYQTSEGEEIADGLVPVHDLNCANDNKPNALESNHNASSWSWPKWGSKGKESETLSRSSHEKITDEVDLVSPRYRNLKSDPVSTNSSSALHDNTSVATADDSLARKREVVASAALARLYKAQKDQPEAAVAKTDLILEVSANGLVSSDCPGNAANGPSIRSKQNNSGHAIATDLQTRLPNIENNCDEVLSDTVEYAETIPCSLVIDVDKAVASFDVCDFSTEVANNASSGDGETAGVQEVTAIFTAELFPAFPSQASKSVGGLGVRDDMETPIPESASSMQPSKVLDEADPDVHTALVGSVDDPDHSVTFGGGCFEAPYRGIEEALPCAPGSPTADKSAAASLTSMIETPSCVYLQDISSAMVQEAPMDGEESGDDLLQSNPSVDEPFPAIQSSEDPKGLGVEDETKVPIVSPASTMSPPTLVAEIVPDMRVVLATSVVDLDIACTMIDAARSETRSDKFEVVFPDHHEQNQNTAASLISIVEKSSGTNPQDVSVVVKDENEEARSASSASESSLSPNKSIATPDGHTAPVVDMNYAGTIINASSHEAPSDKIEGVLQCVLPQQTDNESGPDVSVVYEATTDGGERGDFPKASSCSIDKSLPTIQSSEHLYEQGADEGTTCNEIEHESTASVHESHPLGSQVSDEVDQTSHDNADLTSATQNITVHGSIRPTDVAICNDEKNENDGRVRFEQEPANLPKALVSTDNILRRRQNMEIQKHVDHNERKLNSHKVQGERRATRHVRRRKVAETSLAEVSTKARESLAELPKRELESKEYSRALEEARADEADGSLRTDEVSNLETELIRNMHLMLAMDRQLSLLKKHSREVKKYLQKCKAWLADSSKLDGALTDLVLANASMKFICEETIRRQDSLIAKCISKPQDFMAPSASKPRPSGMRWSFR